MSTTRPTRRRPGAHRPARVARVARVARRSSVVRGLTVAGILSRLGGAR